MTKKFTITKKDSEKRLVFGWASVAKDKNGESLVDYQGDIIEPDELERAAYNFVLKYRATGEDHDPKLRKKGQLVESIVFTKEKQQTLGIPEGIIPEGWYVGFYIDDDDTWERIKQGNYLMFSIEGTGDRVPV